MANKISKIKVGGVAYPISDSNFETYRVTNDQAITAINAKIPTQASSSNQLADKEFVNSSISTNTAEFKGTFNSLQELEAITTADANDYGFVVSTDEAGNTIYKRYKYVDGAWVFEYNLNNSSFTAAQWAAIQSGITTSLVDKLNGIEAGAQKNAANTVIDADYIHTDNNYTTAEKNKLSGIAANAQVNVLEGVQVNGTDLTITDKKVNVTVPTKTSQLTNDDNVVKDASYVHTDNNYTTTEKTKLSGIETGAQVNVLEGIKVDGTELTITDKKVNIDLSGKVDVADSETNSDEFVYRQTGGGLGVEAKNARIGSIKGKTLAWNQMVNFDTPGDTLNGITFVNNGDGSISVTGTNDGIGTSVLRKDLQVIGGHKYLAKGCPSGGSNSTYRLVDDVVGMYSETGSGVIFTASNSTTIGANVKIQLNYSITGTLVFRPVVIDLTLMFGAGNEPTTVEEFESMFPGYHSYEAGKLISNDASAVETVGFNQWDEEWEPGAYNTDTGEKNYVGETIRCKNHIPILPNTQYFINSTGINGVYCVCYYDANKTFISSVVMVPQTITTPANARYMTFRMYVAYGTTYNHDICINLFDPAKNGTYEPYRKSVMQLNLGSFQVRDSQGNVTTITGGLKSAGSVYDEIVGDKYIQRVGSVDLGTLDWRYDSSIFYAPVPGGKIISGVSIYQAAISDKYTYGATLWSLLPDKGFGFGENVTGGNYGSVYINDSAYSDATTFKSAMSGIMLYYELATPIEYDLVEPIRTDYPVNKLGTERVISDTVPTPPFRADITYHEANIKDIEIEGITEYLKREELTDELDKLDTIEEGAQENKIEHIQINGTEQTISNKTVNLPAYPTTLPASDVSAWAKAATKPSYNFSEIGESVANSQLPSSISIESIAASGELSGNAFKVIAEHIAKLTSRIEALENEIGVTDTLTSNSIDSANGYYINGDKTILTGSGAPTVIPAFAGQFYINTSGPALYYAVNNSATTDWKQA